MTNEERLLGRLLNSIASENVSTVNTSVDPFVTPTIFHKFSEDNRGIDPIYTYIRDGGLTEETVGIMENVWLTT